MKIIIPKDVINTLNEYAAAAHPKEFFAFLKGNIRDGKAIVEQAYYHPILSTDKSVSILPSLETHEHGIIGTAHSHPNSYLRPSKADLQVFSGFPVNLIMDSQKFRVYDNAGKEAHYTLIEKKREDTDIDKLHARIFFEAISERDRWQSSYQSSILLIIFAAVMVLLLLIYSLQ